MKTDTLMKLIKYILMCLPVMIWAQQPYYNNVDLTLTGQDLYYALQQKIEYAGSGHTYGDMKDMLKIIDEDPTNSNKVLLIYGYNDNDGNCMTDRSRNKSNFGGGNCQYNREHVFARSNANPSMGSANNGSSGIVADPHNIRASDTKMNSTRGNRKFGDASGNAKVLSSGLFYPGDEWKGDVARMMMYMYTRYGNRCLPSLNGSGTLQPGTDMLQIYLQWNAEDPVNDYEDARNPYLEVAYGNRNPFIDNPYLATLIWGGPVAEDRWNMMSTNDYFAPQVVVYPNPANEFVWVGSDTSFPIETYAIYDTTGRLIMSQPYNLNEKKIDVSALSSGVYLLKLYNSDASVTKKIKIQ
ncbi:MAG: T9SS type A sorting domain-containing protein [Bacteroidetes bacterium]|jgi:hypothetical protein|nr:T9SS type A sorting domain-containing protein [Bacteroidota bacterium]